MKERETKRHKTNSSVAYSFEDYEKTIKEEIEKENYQKAFDLMNEVKELYVDNFYQDAELLTEYGFCIQDLCITNEGYRYPEDEALVFYDKAIALSQNCCLSYYLKGLILAKINGESSIPYFRKAIQLEPNNIEILQKLAQTYTEVADQQDDENLVKEFYQKALDTYEKYLELEPNSINIYEIQSNILRLLNQVEASLISYKCKEILENIELLRTKQNELLSNDLSEDEFYSDLNTFLEIAKSLPDGHKAKVMAFEYLFEVASWVPDIFEGQGKQIEFIDQQKAKLFYLKHLNEKYVDKIAKDRLVYMESMTQKSKPSSLASIAASSALKNNLLYNNDNKIRWSSTITRNEGHDYEFFKNIAQWELINDVKYQGQCKRKNPFLSAIEERKNNRLLEKNKENLNPNIHR